MTDQEIKRIIENGYKTGTVESPDVIMRERIKLKISPDDVRLMFRSAYRQYFFENEELCGDDWFCSDGERRTDDA